MRILFAGTPDIALPSLRALYEAGLDIVAVLTAPDKPAGRRRTLQAPPVKVQAAEWGIPVLQPSRLDGTAREEVTRYQPDLLVVVAYGKIFGPRFLDLFPRGGVNVHPSLLPRYRGPSPIPAAILAGDSVTGVTIQRITLEMDAGEILAQREVPLAPDATVLQLETRLGELGAKLLLETVQSLAAGTVVAREQNEQDASWCGLIRKDDGSLSWQESALQIERMVRAYTPWPGVRCSWNGVPLVFTEAVVVSSGTGETRTDRPQETPGTVLGVDNRAGILVQTLNGVLAVRRLKLQARKEMDFRAFLNGNSSIIGSVLEQA